MKKTYTTPAILMNGSVLRQTMSQDTGLSELIGFNRKVGSVGFNL